MQKQVMITAWDIAREAVVEFGGKAVEYIAEAMRMAWAKIKKERKVMTNSNQPMTYKQKAYTEALLAKKETEMTPNIEYYTLTNDQLITKSEASALIEELLEAPDKEEKETNESIQTIVNNKKKIVNALNNKKKAAFGVELRKAGVKFTYSKQYLYFITEDGKVEPQDAPKEQADLFIEIAKKHVRGLK